MHHMQKDLKAVGLIGFPIILLCIGIAFGGDLSTINPGIAAPARYIYTMAEDGAHYHQIPWKDSSKVSRHLILQ